MKQNTTFSQSASGHAESPFFATIEYPHTISNFHIHLLQGREGRVWFEGFDTNLGSRQTPRQMDTTNIYIYIYILIYVWVFQKNSGTPKAPKGMVYNGKPY